jgi:hypothetical protein
MQKYDKNLRIIKDGQKKMKHSDFKWYLKKGRFVSNEPAFL